MKKDFKYELIIIGGGISACVFASKYLRNNTTKKILSHWKDLFDKNLKIKLKELDGCVENQQKFNHIIAELIDNLEFDDSDSKEKEEEEETTKDNAASENNNEGENALDKDEKNQQDGADQ